MGRWDDGDIWWKIKHKDGNLATWRLPVHQRLLLRAMELRRWPQMWGTPPERGLTDVPTAACGMRVQALLLPEH